MKDVLVSAAFRQSFSLANTKPPLRAADSVRSDIVAAMKTARLVFERHGEPLFVSLTESQLTALLIAGVK